MEMLDELSTKTKYSRPEVNKGKEFISKIQQQFEQDVAELDGTQRAGPSLIH